jgi:uncharacterized protein YjgD (DUF1641 family)
MAEPISDVEVPETDAALLAEWHAVWSVPGQADAIARALDLLRALNDRGLLDAGRALLTDEPTAAQALTEFLRQSRNLRVARNLRALWEVLAAIDLDRVSRRSGPGPGRASAARPMGLWELRRRLRDPDVSAGLQLVLDALAEVGRSRRGTGPSGGKAP